jgi:hypothetical protein
MWNPDYWGEFPGLPVTRTKNADETWSQLREKFLKTVNWYQDVGEVYRLTSEIIMCCTSFIHARRNLLQGKSFLPKGVYNPRSKKSIATGFKLWKALYHSYDDLVFNEFSDLLPPIETMRDLEFEGYAKGKTMR